jgi:protein TonB
MSGLAEEDLDESNLKFWLKRIGMVLVLLAVGMGGWLLFSSLVSSKVSMKKPMTTVKLLPDTPPPPPPPPPPKEQMKEQPKEIKVEQPKPQEAPQPPAEVLKMEGAAGDGQSPFAAGSVSNDYKGGPTEPVKIGGGTNLHQFSWYTGMLKTQIEDALAKDKKLASGDYKVVVKVWVSKNGRIERYELSGSSGKPETDELIKTALGEMPPLSEGPPQDMPQPVKLRVTARSSG